MLQLAWFKRDLRTTDHAGLSEAARHGPVLPLYIVEPGLWAQPDMSGRQWAFQREALRPLRDELAAAGQPLVIRTWLPELNAVSDEWLHAPWRTPESEQVRRGVRIGRDHPAPLVDHEAAARRARQRVQGARRGPEAVRQSRAVHTRHGSRKPTRRRWHGNLVQADLFDDGAS